MRHGYGVTDKVIEQLIERVVTARAPEKLGLLEVAKGRALSEEQREDLREVLADELMETGLDAEDEPTDRGRLLESAIDWLGRR